MAKDSGVLKAGKFGGRYLTFSGDEPHMKIHNIWQTVKFAFPSYHESVGLVVGHLYLDTFIIWMP